MRIHKGLKNNQLKNEKENQIHEALLQTKETLDEMILKSSHILSNIEYFTQELINQVVINFMDKHKIIKEEDENAFLGIQNIGNLIYAEYQNSWKSWR